MRDLRLWQVNVLTRTDSKGKAVVSGYEISAGPALLAFHKYVYMPWRIRQITDFYAQHIETE